MHTRPEFIRMVERLAKREGFDLAVTHVMIYSKDDAIGFRRSIR